MRVVVAYDIVADRRRGRVAKRMVGFLQRVQKSVFEGEVSDTRLESLRKLLGREMNPEEDSARVYHLCARCLAATEVIGVGSYIEREGEDLLV